MSARHPEFLKIGLRVRYIHPVFGWAQDGRVDGNDVRSNGVWTRVNIAPLGQNRVLKTYRPSQLTPI